MGWSQSWASSNELSGGRGLWQLRRASKAKFRFEAAAAQANPDQIVWAYRSAQKLPGFDQGQWQPRLETAREGSRGQTSWGYYNRGMINNALGHAADAEG